MNRTEIEERARRIRNDNPPGTVFDTYHPNYSFLVDLLRRHEKYISDPDFFGIRRNAWQRNEIIYLTPEGKWDNFSLKKCLSCRPVTESAKRASAFRYLVRKQIIDFRVQNNRCACCNQTLDLHEGQIDHIRPFRTLVAEFCEDRVLGPLIRVPEESVYIFQDWKIQKDWIEFHARNCSLQLLCTNCHLKKTKADLLVVQL